ncbi:hypothetical protein D9M70_511700 [compost metagenome]
MHEIGRHGRQVEVLRGVDGAVEQDDRNFRVLCFLQHLVPAGSDNRGDEDGVHALRDEGADRLDLVFLFLLRICEFKVDAALLCLLLGQRRLGGAPAGLRADLRKADDQIGRGSTAERAGSKDRCTRKCLGDFHDVLPKKAASTQPSRKNHIILLL